MLTAMRKVVVVFGISLDGFFEGPNGEIDWHLMDEERHQEINEYLAGTGAFIHGRRMYELMADYWPTADSDPDAPAPIRDFARIWREMPKVLYSTTLQSAEWADEVLSRVDADEVKARKAQPGGDLVVGGAELAEAFRREGLVDEYRLYVHPVVLGRGKPLFTPGDHVALRLLEHRLFSNGVVMLRYAVS